MKKFVKWLLISIAAFIVVLVAMGFLTQTQFFRNQLRSFALAQLDSLLNADVHLGEITGNLIGGFSIDSVSISVQDKTFLTASALMIRYDLFQLPSKRVTVGSLTLVRPQIALLRGRDSVWNFERMIRPTPDDPEATPFDWPIVVGKLQMQEGTVRLIDSASLADPDHERGDPYFVEFHDFLLRNFSMEISSVLIAPDDKRAKINYISFVSDTPTVTLKRLAGTFRVTNREATVQNMTIETTRSKLFLDASLKNFSLLDGIELTDLQTKPVDLTLRANAIDFDELKRFIPQIDFLHGKVNLELAADGEFGRLRVRQLDLGIGSSQIYMAGTVSNLHLPEMLLLNVKCRESKIAYADVLRLMPTKDLPDYTSLGASAVDFDFDGEPHDFVTKLSVKSDVGSVSTPRTRLIVGGPHSLTYEGEIVGRDVNLAAVLRDEKLDGRVNGAITIKGHGTSLNTLVAQVEAQFDSSEIFKTQIGHSRFSLTSRNRIVDGTVSLAVGSMQATLSGNLNRTKQEEPSFAVAGDISSLNLADILHDKSQSSDLSLKLKAEGTGLQWDKLNGHATLDFSSSRYGDYQIDSGLVNLNVDQRDRQHSTISLRSSIADFTINGQFDLDYVVGILRYEVENMSLAIGQRFKSMDSSLATTLDVKAVSALGKRIAAERKHIDAAYELHVKNLEPISVLTQNRMFNAVGRVNGSLKGDYENLEGDARLVLDEFFYGNADSGMLIQDGIATLRFSDLKPINPLTELRLRVTVDAGKMHLNRTKLDTLKFGIFYDKEYAGFSVQADYDRDLHLLTNGQVSVSDDGVEFKLSRTQVSYKDFLWKVNDGAIAMVNQSGMRIPGFTLQRDAQSIGIKGALLKGGILEASITGKNLDLRNLRYVLTKEEGNAADRGFEGIANIDVSASGPMTAPAYELKFQAEHVAFRGFPFGIVRGASSYRDLLLDVHLLIDNRSSTQAGKPDLTVEGTIPINLALAEVEKRLSDQPMNLKVYSDGLQMNLLDPLVPTFNELTGVLKADLKVSGTPQHPVYAGQIGIENCAFRFMPNNILYEKLNARLEADNDRIRVVEASVYNIPSDNKPGRQGKLTITGDFRFRDFVPSDFNFTINGQLVTVNKNTRLSSLAVYGDLFVEIPSPGLRYTGSIENSLLKGRVFVRNSSFILPPTTSNVREESELSLPIVFVDDTSKAIPTIDPVVSRYFAVAESLSRVQERSPGQRRKSFIDGVHYDLDVACIGGNNEIRIIFNAATNEELVASIDGQFAITEDGRTWVGELDVSRASYNFYGKRFAADGTLLYTGDFMDPELNITATYKSSRPVEDGKIDERVVVIYKISGSRLAPRSEVSMKIDDVDYASYTGEKSGDVQSDALTFVITGNFPITRGQANAIAENLKPAVTSTVVGGATSLLTSTFSEFLRARTGIINSIEFGYETGGTTSKDFSQRADIRLSGTLFKGYWRYGGKILEDPFANANFSILYSFGDIFDQPMLRNFMFEYERRVLTSTYTQIDVTDRRDVNSARLFYRFSF
ncbi:MAG: hypothetical protein HY961_04320 [Ignavibacteriae bacterium]|nr:hypothetical protein [Ignavibacteriota bacterium]